MPNDNVVFPVPSQEVHSRNGCGDLPRPIHPSVGLPPKLFLVQHVRLWSLHIGRADVYRIQVEDRERTELLEVARV